MAAYVPAPRYVQPGTFAHEDRVRMAQMLAAWRGTRVADELSALTVPR